MSKRIYYAILLSLLCLSASYSYSQAYRVGPFAQNGLVDLRKQSLSTELALNGEWLFYWHQLLSPNQVPASKGVPVDFPDTWNGHPINGRELPAFGYATYKLQVLLPKTTQPLRIAVPDVYSAYALYINGKKVAVNGLVGTNAESFEPHWQYKVVDIPEGTDTLNIVLQISNFAHSKGGIKKPLLIAYRDVIELDRRHAEAVDLLLTGCLFMGGIFFLGLYLLGNRDKAILLFSIYSIVYSYRVIGTDNYALHTILPDINWYIAVRLEYITLFVGIGLFGLYTMYLYPKDVNKRVVYSICSVCFSFGFVTLFLPPVFFTRLINPFLVVMLYCLVYIPYVYLHAYRNHRPGSLYALLSSFALMSVFAISLFHYWGLIPQLQLCSFFGYVGFFFLQSLVLSHRVSFVLKSAREQAEQGLIAKSEFLSTMSHEIRTPLNSVIGMSHLLLKNNPRPDQVEQLDVMLFSANNLLAIVNDILDYNKIEAGKITFEYTEMDLAAIARNIVTGLQNSAQDKGIALKLNVDEGLKNKILGDPTRIFQVVTNLVHNAIKFTQVGYVELQIVVKRQTDAEITLEVRVTDTGIGISPEKQEIIFERFTQADSSTSRGFGGTGLGLAISKRILELQNSKLQLQSEEGRGSTFYFIKTFEKSIKTLAQQKLEDNAPKENDKPFTGVQVLLVEDNAMNVLVAQKFLQRWGAVIDVAVNGQDALDKVDPSRHNVILMDLNMPLMDGFDSAISMRAKGIKTPIIALTANLPAEVEERVKQAGMDDIVVKPFLPDELFRKVLMYGMPRS